MRSRYLTLGAVAAAIVLGSWAPSAAPVPPATANGVGPVFASIGPLTFDNSGTLFAGDAQNAAIFALDLAGRPKAAPRTSTDSMERLRR